MKHVKIDGSHQHHEYPHATVIWDMVKQTACIVMLVRYKQMVEL